ncbi:hypothetical protein ACTJJ0_02985 [Chitinophaga sp. 22321]|uniref:Peptidase n=1 Tax=Chitinophaga hostae TaxID=2831022 RepID=A0ABS5JAL5_9BACT|nr:hypothetical protein [Chitinophaga hostae]MBS0032136.1 hypothetical protein [Chitinophaga hostae]
MKNNVILLAAVALIAGFSGCSKKDNPAPQKPTKDMAGCQGYASGYANSGIVGAANTFDFKISQNNQFFAEEVGIQRGFWNGIPAEVHVLYEPAEDYRNAYASPDGKILFGYEMFYYLVRSFSKISGSNNLSPLPVDGVLAHEWGHRVQFTVGWNDYTKPSYRELEADFFSGYYMGLAKQWLWGQIQTYYNAIYASGDYYYNSPDHHGTPQQRLNAAYAGLTTAVYELNNNVHYTYNQLHSIFNQKVHDEIGARKSSVFPEVVYPKNLDKEKIKQLYPTL